VALARAENRVNFLRGSLTDQSGQKIALPYFSQDSSLISSLVGSHGLIEVGTGTTPIAAGERVGFIPYESLLK
jgi:molybdopterin biosynthesis enzyme